VDLGLSDEQQELVASFARLLAKRSPPERVRDAEPGGFDEGLWRALREAGSVTMAVGEAHGGWGAGLLDIALVAEEVGRALAPAPVIEAQVAVRLLAAVAGAGGAGRGPAAEALAQVLDHGCLVTVAVRPARDCVAALVPAGAVCDGCVALVGDRLVLASVGDLSRQPVANLAHAPLADLDLDPGSTVELATGRAAVELFEVAVDEWLVLTAASLVGIGAAAHQMVCGYARERQAFGAPIGSFQGVSHPLADDATNLDGARLLVRKAAWTLDRQGRRGRELAAMAFSFASRTAATATYDGVHLHGGYGFMLEHDAQLFYRRARGWSRVWGDAEAADRRAALARYGARRG
jgi:alkylation response protein AidB-like acyl-CoA dehydrogenase